MKQSPSDPVIDEIREVRHRISARVDHDPARLVAYYMELQKQYQDRLVETGESAEHEYQSDVKALGEGASPVLVAAPEPRR